VATKTIIEAMAEEIRRDERVIVLGEDAGVAGGVFGATQGLYTAFGALRMLNTPLTESDWPTTCSWPAT
jgi:pyruvate/2-oxoglutarate/acetoin dehydrogenase E1 component